MYVRPRVTSQAIYSLHKEDTPGEKQAELPVTAPVKAHRGKTLNTAAQTH